MDDRIWVGNSDNEKSLPVGVFGAVLNVAQELHGTNGWNNGIEYAQVGLIDGPGNKLSAYYAAVLTLDALIERTDKNVLVCCHRGGRALAVVLMYLNGAINAFGWGWWIGLIKGQVDFDLPVIHESHRNAFDKMDWELIWKLTGQDEK